VPSELEDRLDQQEPSSIGLPEDAIKIKSHGDLYYYELPPEKHPWARRIVFRWREKDHKYEEVEARVPTIEEIEAQYKTHSDSQILGSVIQDSYMAPDPRDFNLIREAQRRGIIQMTRLNPLVFSSLSRAHHSHHIAALNCGADINTLNPSNQTVLEYWISNLKHQWNIRDKSFFARNSELVIIGQIRELLEHGAKVTTQKSFDLIPEVLGDLVTKDTLLVEEDDSSN